VRGESAQPAKAELLPPLPQRGKYHPNPMYPCLHHNSFSFQKNPLLGKELLWFANPNKPDGTPAEGEAPKPAGEEAGEGEGGKLFEDLKDVVTGAADGSDYDPEVQSHWLAMLGDYNGVQNNINKLLKQKKTLEDDRLFNKPRFQKDFKSKVGPQYEQLLEISKTLGRKVDKGTFKRIRENAMEELKSDRAQAVRDTDTVIKALLQRRNEALQDLGRQMKEDLSKRLKHLKNQWKTKPPKGYEDVNDGWVAYCSELITVLDSLDLAKLDKGDPEFPNGDAIYADAKKWWDMAGQLEASYKNFSKVDVEELTNENLAKRFEALKAKVKSTTEGEKNTLEVFNQTADKILAAEREVRPMLEQKIAETEDGPDKEFWGEQLKVLNDRMEELNKKKDLKGMIDVAFNSKKPTEEYFPAPNAEGKVFVPEGIEGRLEFLRSTPMDNATRRAVARRLLDGMKSLEENIESYKTFGELQGVEALENIRLFKQSMPSGSGDPGREWIWVNPFETMSHVWHSVTTTVKGNLETEAKRGAGYFQKQGTEILAKIPNPTNNQIIKSFSELSPNGAQEAEHAEHGRVGDIEKGYDAFNTEHLLHLAATCNDRWEFKACLNLLAKRGRVDFYAPWLFKQFSRWQKTVDIPQDPYWHQKNLTGSGEKLRQAYFYIYRDSEGYKNMKNTNASSYESKMGEFSKNWGAIAAEPGALRREAEKIIQLYENDHHKGVHFSTADPIKFESIIRYGIDQGKMKAEDRLNLMVRGIASGLLPFDRGVNGTDKNNTYPPMDWFDSATGRGEKPTIDDVKELAVYAKNAQTWDYYMHKKIMYNTLVSQRIEKTLSQGGHRVDHDDAPMLAGYLQVDRVRAMLTDKSGAGYPMQTTGLLAMSVGNEFWLDMYAEIEGERDAQTNKLEMVRFASQFLMYEGILNRRVYKDQTNMFRLEPSDAAKKPRNAGSYSKVFGRSEKQTTGQLLKGVAGKLTMLDFDKEIPLIKKLINGEIRTDEDAKNTCMQLEAKHKGIFDGTPPQTIDKLYDAIPVYLKYSLEKDESLLGKLVAQVKSEQAANTKNFKEKEKLAYKVHHLDHDLEAVRKAATDRANGIPEDPHAHAAHGDHGDDHGGGDHHAEHPAEGGDHGAHPPAGGGGAHGDDHGAAAAAHAGAVKGSTHGH